MFETRIPETDTGIQDEVTVDIYDQMQRNLRDADHLPTDHLVTVSQGVKKALEIGPGPGYFGLEWLKKTKETRLTGLEISPAMIRVATKNAASYQVSDRVTYREGNALCMPFEDDSFDMVFSNGSLHEWEDAKAVFCEARRVVRPGGMILILDLRRDLSPDIYQYMYENCKPAEIRPGFTSSVQAAYTPEELQHLLSDSKLSGWQVFEHPFGLGIIGNK